MCQNQAQRDEEFSDVELVQAIIGPCPKCGAEAPAYSPEEAEALLNFHRDPTHPAKAILAYIRELDYLCDNCSAALEESAESRRSHERYQRLVSTLLTKELITKFTLGPSFEASDPDIEARNLNEWDWARDWTAGRENVWFYGPPGLGKTYMARCLLKRSAENGRSIAEVPAAKWLQKSPKWEENTPFLAALKTVGVLLIEDVDKAIWTVEGINAFWELLDARYTANRRTFLTSNVDPEYFLGPGGSWRRGDNPSRANAIAERLLPLHRVQMRGTSLRRETKSSADQAETGNQASDAPGIGP